MALFQGKNGGISPRQLGKLLQATNDLIQGLSGTSNEDELLTGALEALCSLTHASYGSIALVENNTTVNFANYCTDITTDNPLSPSSAAQLINLSDNLGEPFRLDRCAGTIYPATIKSLLCVPLLSNSETLGHIFLCDKNENETFTSTDECLTNTFASSLALILENARHRADRTQTNEQMRLHAKVFNDSTEAVVIADNKGLILSVNQSFSRITGYQAEEVIGHSPKILGSNKQDPVFHKRLWADLNEYGHWHGELRDIRKNGDIFPAWLSISAIKNDGGEITHYVGLINDMSERKRYQEQIHYLAYYDAITDLPNRALFQDRIQQLVSVSDRNRRLFAIMAIDLDHFKNINDSIGHSSGDKLLRQVASRLFKNIRTGDTAARIGGDEFGVALCNLSRSEDAATAAQKIIKALEQPFTVDNQEIFITASIGISLYPNDGDNAANLQKHAEAAMFYAKSKHRNNYQFYRAEINADTSNRLRLEANLRHALENEEFVLHYQPKYNLINMEIDSVEALIRWQHPLHGMIQPDDFVPLLEESGLITQVGKWVIKTACKQINHWQEIGITPPRVAVNVSARQFEDEQFIDDLEEILTNQRCCTDYLEFEITETTLMNDAAASSHALEKIKDMGIHLSIDDFGTGYSSLAYLSRFPIDTLKIDRTFIQSVTQNSNDTMITRSVIDLAHNLGIKALAEGIETQEQLDFLISLGCDSGQGFLFSRPVDAPTFISELKQAS